MQSEPPTYLTQAIFEFLRIAFSAQDFPHSSLVLNLLWLARPLAAAFLRNIALALFLEFMELIQVFLWEMPRQIARIMQDATYGNLVVTWYKIKHKMTRSLHIGRSPLTA
ncbi:hypothetical protein TALK_15415 [Thalassospira alkalitolerans]|uniref:Uncharacterized protein n=1 Tax=Thalassospira alkalitolerans TaxID=1293890 RepID=A0A1Y2L996_9PROT|nr:hypothetical protein TALK_15415 [Thalassospira alkalitolerans]